MRGCCLLGLLVLMGCSSEAEKTALAAEIEIDGFELENLGAMVQHCGICCLQIEQDVSQLSRTETMALEGNLEDYLRASGVRRAGVRLIHVENAEQYQAKVVVGACF